MRSLGQFTQRVLQWSRQMHHVAAVAHQALVTFAARAALQVLRRRASGQH